MKRPLLTAVLLIGAVAGAYRLGIRAAPPPDPELAKLKQAVDQLGARIAQSESAPAKPVVVAAELTAATPTGPSPAASNTSPKAETAGGSTVAAVSQVDIQAYYQTSFDKQAIDGRWSRQSSALLRDLFGQLTTQGTTLRSVDCRETMCRAEITHDTETESREFMNKWTNAEGFLAWKGPMSGGVTGEPRPDGTLVSVIFLAREGTELPEFN